MTKVILTRHGHVEGIAPQRFRGRADMALTSMGRQQAAAVARRIAASWPPHAVYTSPLRRCVDTGRIIAETCGVASTALSELTDLDYGAWQWRTYQDVEAASPHLFRAWFETPERVRFPDGDSLQDLVSRTADCLRLMLDRHPDETVTLVGHDSVNRALLLQLLDQPLSAYWRLAQSPCAINEIDIADGKIQVQRINDTSHLDDGG